MIDPETSQGFVDPRVHRVARHPEILEPEGELLAHGQLRCRQLIGGRREDDPDLAEKRGRRGRRSVAAVHDDATGQLRTDDPRHEPGCRKRQGGLARSGPSGDAQALPGLDREGHPFQAPFAASRIADAEPATSTAVLSSAGPLGAGASDPMPSGGTVTRGFRSAQQRPSRRSTAG